MAYDGARGQVVLFGGNGTGSFGGVLGDTWTWDGSAWTEQHPPTSPSPRSFMGMAYDAARKEVVLFGGSPDQGGDEVLGDTWTWDGSTWTERAPPTSPPGRYGMGMVYDAALKEIVLFGGSYSYPDYFGDTWTWDGTTWTQQSSSRFPPSRVRMGMAYDAPRRRVVLFGGFDGSVQKLGDTWLWDGSQWTMASPATSPDPREGVAMAYDRTRDLVVLFGGKIGKAPWDRDDTWTWDGSNWRQEPPAPSPSMRHTAGVAYDGAGGRVLLFGGCSVEGLCPMGDTWTYDGASWTERVIVNAPSARNDVGMAYDAARQQVVLFGGCCEGQGARFADTWTWDGAAWTEEYPSFAPDAEAVAGMAYDGAHRSAVLFIDNFFYRRRTWTWNGTRWFRRSPVIVPDGRSDAGMAYDTARQETVMFGGEAYDDGCECDISLGDTWTLDGTNFWTERHPATVPNARDHAGMAYDAARGEAVMFGGYCYPFCGGILGDTWTWDGTNWAQEDPVSSPEPQRGLSMAYDPVHARVVLFGVDGTTWTWDGTDWTEEHPATSPPARSDAGMVFDGARQQIVLFGGVGAGVLNDTWAWDGTSWNRVG